MTDGRPTYAEEITRVFRQVVGVVLVSWRRILRAGLVSGALALLGAEIAACLVTGSFPPPTAAHLAAVALALAIGYSVAATMLFALLSTFLGVFLDSYFPNYRPLEYVPQISDGKIGVFFKVPESEQTNFVDALNQLGAESVEPHEARQL